MKEKLLPEPNDVRKQSLTNECPLSLHEAAIFLGLSNSTLYKLTHRRKIPYYKPNGKKIYFTRSDLLEWIMSKRVASESEIEKQAEDYIQSVRKSNRNIKHRRNNEG